MEELLLSRKTSQWLIILISILACRDHWNATHPLVFFGLRNFCNVITPEEIKISSFNTNLSFSVAMNQQDLPKLTNLSLSQILLKMVLSKIWKSFIKRLGYQHTIGKTWFHNFGINFQIYNKMNLYKICFYLMV